MARVEKRRREEARKEALGSGAELGLTRRIDEGDCGKINPSHWRVWLATEAIAKGLDDNTHQHGDILPTQPGARWERCLGRRE